jgi:hypothetical protein
MKRSAVFLLALTLAGCGGGGKSSENTKHQARSVTIWPAPPDPMERTRLAGLTPETHEFVLLHVHAHLDIFRNGKPVSVPAGIGINIDDPAVRRFKVPDGSIAYGGIRPPCQNPCISPLHTHADDGVLHTEAKEHEFNTLGEFFTEWDVRLDANCIDDSCRPKTPVAVYVDGKKFDGDPRSITLENLREIAIVIGTPPDEIPETFPTG